MYFVYILRTDKNTLYVGQTNDLERRLAVHKTSRGSKYLRMFRSFELVYQEPLPTLSEALKRESEIKKLTKKSKEELLLSKNLRPFR